MGERQLSSSTLADRVSLSTAHPGGERTTRFVISINQSIISFRLPQGCPHLKMMADALAAGATTILNFCIS
jgi:hypothetical protein